MGELFAGRYELVDVLGHGGMGTVWRVWDRRERAYRAGKMLRQSDSASLLRFVRETATRIDHPHVVAPSGWSAEDDRVMFAMPLVRGGSVATLLSAYGRLPAAWAHELTTQLLSALVAVHEAGLVHRDLKPANLLLAPTGRDRPRLLLSDFGIAAPIDEPRLTRSHEYVGTPGYTAPEVRPGTEPLPTHDLYAAGLVAHELLVGRRGPEAVVAPELPAHVAGTAFGAVLTALVALDPVRRPASADEALARLRAAPVPPDPPGSGRGSGAGGRVDVEVVDRLPPLPHGWTDLGPGPGAEIDSTPRPAVRVTSAEAGERARPVDPDTRTPLVGPSTQVTTPVPRTRTARAPLGTTLSAPGGSGPRQGRGDLVAAGVLAVVGMLCVAWAAYRLLG